MGIRVDGNFPIATPLFYFRGCFFCWWAMARQKDPRSKFRFSSYRLRSMLSRPTNFFGQTKFIPRSPASFGHLSRRAEYAPPILSLKVRRLVARTCGAPQTREGEV